jgi:hypothetical protein
LQAALWKGTSLILMGAKVAWSSICYPLKEGGLGLKSLKTWKRVATMKHIWCILTDKHSIWATWVHTTLLRGRSFWQLNIPSNPSWSWRKVLQSRDWCRGKFTTCIGNGNTTYLWFDYWLPDGKRINDMLPLRTLTYKVTLKCKGLGDHQRGWLELSKQYPSLSSNLELYSFSARTPHGRSPRLERESLRTIHHRFSLGVASRDQTCKYHSPFAMVRRSYPSSILHPLACFSGAPSHYR